MLKKKTCQMAESRALHYYLCPISGVGCVQTFPDIARLCEQTRLSVSDGRGVVRRSGAPLCRSQHQLGATHTCTLQPLTLLCFTAPGYAKPHPDQNIRLSQSSNLKLCKMPAAPLCTSYQPLALGGTDTHLYYCTAPASSTTLYCTCNEYYTLLHPQGYYIAIKCRASHFQDICTILFLELYSQNQLKS